MVIETNRVELTITNLTMDISNTVDRTLDLVSNEWARRGVL